MAHEIILTSVRQGADPNRQGFCAVAHDRHAPAGLIRTLEEVSVYHHLYPPDSPEATQNPVTFSHTVFRQLGHVYHVLSRVGNAGIDFQLHSNRLAHHIVLEPEELPPEGPTWLMMQPGFLLREWLGPPVIFERCRPIPTHTTSSYTLPHIAFSPDWYTSFQYQRGIETLVAAVAHQRPVVLFFSPSMKLFPLVAEVVGRLAEADRWKATFSTYHHTPSLETPPLCLIQCVLKDSLEARLRIPPSHELVIDLTVSGGAMFDASERTADAAWNPPSGTFGAIHEIAPPAGHSSEIGLRPHGTAQVVESIVRVRSRLLFYSVYGAATALVLCFLLLLLGRLFHVGPFTFDRAAVSPKPLTAPAVNDVVPVARHAADPNALAAHPAASLPVDTRTLEEITAAWNAQRQERITAARPLLAQAKSNMKWPSVVPLVVPKRLEGEVASPPPPQILESFAPLFVGGHILDLAVVSAFAPASCEFRAIKQPPIPPSTAAPVPADDAPFVWRVLAFYPSGDPVPFLEIRLSPKGLEFEWLPDAVSPLTSSEAALIALGELQFRELETDNTFTTLASIPLWKRLTIPSIPLVELFAPSNTSHRVHRSLFFDTPPWSDVFADHDPKARLVFTVAPLDVSIDTIRPAITKFETVISDDGSGAMTLRFTTDVTHDYTVGPGQRKTDPIDVAVRIVRKGGKVEVVDETGLQLQERETEVAAIKTRLEAITPEIANLQRENMNAPSNERRDEINALRTEKDAKTVRLDECESWIKALPLAREVVVKAVDALKLAIDFSLDITMPDGKPPLTLQSTGP